MKTKFECLSILLNISKFSDFPPFNANHVERAVFPECVGEGSRPNRWGSGVREFTWHRAFHVREASEASKAPALSRIELQVAEAQRFGMFWRGFGRCMPDIVPPVTRMRPLRRFGVLLVSVRRMTPVGGAILVTVVAFEPSLGLSGE